MTNPHRVSPPVLPDGPPRLTQDSVERMVVWKVNYPESVQRKAGAIHGPVVGGSAAAVVITDFLHRPYVTSAVMADDTARHAGNEAPFDRFRPASRKPSTSAGRRCRGGSVGSTARHS
ncbi:MULTISPECIES: DUF6192 family protein [Streptomyces]|uniref:DUF6192 family protein n=1 Tax=Streptomyces TaxID=1883 RepID=UPI003526C79D